MKKAVLTIIMSLLLILGVGFYDGSVVDGEESEPITTIHIVTPAWKNQAHEDGTGLFFDIVRAVMSPLE